MTGTARGGLCVADQRGQFLFWSSTEGFERAPVIEKISAITVVPNATGCCAYSNHIEMCRGGDFEGREEYLRGQNPSHEEAWLPFKSGSGFLMTSPTMAMSRQEWESIGYYRTLDGPNEPGPWFDEFPRDNTFLRNALLSVCAGAPPRESFCSATSPFFDFVGTANIIEIVFGGQVACVLREDEELLCYGPGRRHEASGVVDVDIGTSSICIATRTEFECWPNSPAQQAPPAI